MVTIKFSNKQELVLLQWLGETLGLREGDRVEVQRYEDVLQLHPEPQNSPGPLKDIAHIITSSHPVGSVDIALYMDRHGYEQLDNNASRESAASSSNAASAERGYAMSMAKYHASGTASGSSLTPASSK